MDGGTVDRGAHKRNTWVRIPSLPTFNKIFSTDDCSRYIGSIKYEEMKKKSLVIVSLKTLRIQGPLTIIINL